MAEPHLFERSLEQHLVLEAIAAAPASAHFVREAVRVEYNRMAGARIEVL